MPTPMHSVTSAVEIAPLQFVEPVPRIIAPVSHARGDGTAVHVDLPAVDIESLHIEQHDRGEGLVQFEQVNVLDRHAILEHFSVTGTDRSAIEGSEPMLANCRICARLQPDAMPAFLLPTSTAAAPSTIPDELPGVWTIDRLDLG